MFPRKTVYLLLGALIVLSIILRYPLVEHERYQTDSYFIHILSQSIVDEGESPWTFNPLSFFGYYPFSYPSGVPFLVAGISSFTGMSVEISILVMNMGLAVLFCLAVFLLARQFNVKNEYALLATLFAIVASRFVDSSYWVASARAPLLVMFILISFVAFRATSMRRPSYYAILAVFIIGALVVHHMAVLLLLFGVGYVLATIESQYLLPRIKRKKRVVAIGANVLLLVSVLLIAFGLMDYFRELTSTTFEESGFLNLGHPTLSLLANTAASYTNQIGFILIVAIIGAPSVLRRAHLGSNSLFLITVLIAFVPMVGNSLYISIVIAPFVALLGTKWLSQLMASRRRFIAILLVVFLVAVSIPLPLWSTDRWNSVQYSSGDTVEVDNTRFNDAAYVRVIFGEHEAITNTYTLTLQMHALTDARFLGSGIMLAINGEVVQQDIKNNVTWSSREFPTNLYVWFEYDQEPNVDYFILRLMMEGHRSITSSTSTFLGFDSYWQKHENLVVIIDNKWPSNAVSQYSVIRGDLVTELRNAVSLNMPIESYAIYQSSGTTTYLLGL